MTNSKHIDGMSRRSFLKANAGILAVVLLANIMPINTRAAEVKASISLDKTLYKSGENITVTYSGFPGDPTDKIAFYYSAWASSTSGSAPAARYSLWEYVSGTDGQITFTNNLAMGDYVAVYLRGRKRAMSNTVEFSVVSGIDNGAGVLDYQMFIGPADLPGARDFADPAVIKEGSSWFITGTYTMASRPHYMVETSDWQNKTLHTLSIDMNTAYLKKHFNDPTFWTNNLWKFTPYKHTDGSWHAYGAFMHKSTWTTSIAHFEPLDTQWPITRWRLNKVLHYGYDQYFVLDGSDLYMLYAGAGIRARKMLDPENLDPSFTPRYIIKTESLNSEYRNGTSGMQLMEGPSIKHIVHSTGSKYAMFYSVGDFAISNYKLGVAYCDVLIPPAGQYYTKSKSIDRLNLWGNGAGLSEVSYLFQTYIPAWNNYFGKYLSAPGIGTLIEYNRNYYTVFHGIRPDQPTGATGQLKRTARSRWVYIAPVKIDFSEPETDANKWIKPMKPTTNRPRVN